VVNKINFYFGLIAESRIAKLPGREGLQPCKNLFNQSPFYQYLYE